MEPREIKHLIETEVYYGLNLGLSLHALKDVNPILFNDIVLFFKEVQAYRKGNGGGLKDMEILRDNLKKAAR